MKSLPEEPSIATIPKGYRAYEIKGLDHTIIARKGGPTAHQIKFNKSYQELRNNQKEFGVFRWHLYRV